MQGQNRRNFLARTGLLNELETIKDISHNPDIHPARGFCTNEDCRPAKMRDPMRDPIKWYAVSRVGVVMFKTSDVDIDACDWGGYYLYWSTSYSVVDGCTKLANEEIRECEDVDLKKPKPKRRGKD